MKVSETMVIYKYPLSVVDEQTVQMPVGAQPLSVQVQRGVPCLWSLVDPVKPFVAYTVRIAGTGHPMERHPGQYISTFQMQGGSLVFHAFWQHG